MGPRIALGITTSLHDAVIDQFSFDAARSRLESIIWESNEDKSVVWWRLIISGIRNRKEVQQFQATIDAILVREKRKSLGFRIDESSYKKQAASENDVIYIVSLFIDHLPLLRVECQKCTLLCLN
jgi:c-di-AMP phosphodiesterase-like protein